MLILSIILTLFFLYLYTISPSIVYVLIVLITLSFKGKLIVIIISRVKEIDKLDLNLEELEVYYNSNTLDFRRFSFSSK